MGMEDRDGVIWVDGELVPWREAKVHVLTHSLHYGMGVFEGIRAYKTARGTALFRMPEHVDRMFTSAHILQMHIPFSHEQIAQGLRGGHPREQPGRRLRAPAGVLRVPKRWA